VYANDGKGKGRIREGKERGRWLNLQISSPSCCYTFICCCVYSVFVLYVISEVLKATETASALYHRWQELVGENASVSKEDLSWTTNELRNCLRSIEWDLEDLEETIYIL